MEDYLDPAIYNPSLRGLRERLVAVAQEIEEERRHKRSFGSPSRRSLYSPDLEGSVLKNDLKQRLVKERREERKRQQEANKEKQLLEKERKAKLQYEKQLEEKQRRLKEHKEKDERRRISAEEKRKQKLAEDKEKFKAVVSRTMERCNRVEQKQKRRRGESSMTNTANKPGKAEAKRSSSMNKKVNKVSSNVNQDHMDKTTGVPKYVFRYVTVPMFTSEELKASAMFSKSTVKKPLSAKVESTSPEKGETSLKRDVIGPTKLNMGNTPKASAEVPPNSNKDIPAKANVKLPRKVSKKRRNPDVNVDTSPKWNIEVPVEVNTEGHPKSKVQENLRMRRDSCAADELPRAESNNSSIISARSSEKSIGISPLISINVSAGGGIDTSPELSVDSANMEIAAEENRKPVASGEAQLEGNTRSETRVKKSFKKREMGKRTSNIITKKQTSANIPCYKWPSSPAIGGRSPSPVKSIGKILKNRSPSPFPTASKLPVRTSLSCKITPGQNILYVPNVISIITKKRQKHKRKAEKQKIISEDSAHKSIRSGGEATKIMAECHHPGYEQKDEKKKERYQYKVKPSVSKQRDTVAEKADGSPPEESSTPRDELPKKHLSKKRHEKWPEDLEVLQKGDAVIKSPDYSEERKQELKRIMLRNLQERLERTKLVEISDSDTPEEEEADDENESESDEDSFDGVYPLGPPYLSATLAELYKNANRKPQRLVFLQAGTDEVQTQKKIYLNGNMNVRPKEPKDSWNHLKSSWSSTKNVSTYMAKPRKSKEAYTTLRSTLSDNTHQERVYDQITDISHNTESPAIKVTPYSNKYHLKEFLPSSQGPRVPWDFKKRNKSVSVALGETSSYPQISGRAADLTPFTTYTRSRAAFREKEDSDD